MDMAETDRFNDDIMKEVATKYELSLDRLSFVGGFQNFIYEYQASGKEYILRFTPHSHRTIDAVHAELEWVSYLASHGISVSKPIRSADGNSLEVLQAKDSCVIVSAFEKAIGAKIGYPQCLTDTDLFEMCGKFTAQMHVLAKDFTPNSRRHHWRDNYYIRNLANYVPVSQEMVHQSCHELMKEIDRLPKNRDCYGIIHGDINVGNFHVSDSGLTLFDFDECQYSWFVEDIAIQLYYLVYVFGDDSPDERNSQASVFMKHFLKGYTSWATIDQYWIQQIPLFLRLREIIVYTGMHRSYDLDHLDGWSSDYITQSRMRIENGTSIVNVDSFMPDIRGS